MMAEVAEIRLWVPFMPVFPMPQQELFSSQGIEAPKDITDVAFRLTTENDEDLDIFVESFYQFGKDFYNIDGTVGLRYNF